MKLLKDPIYGYIDIDIPILHSIIDSPSFQRLRNIRQTSYAPLYPSAVHNRFAHSIGVYFLGRKAFESFKGSIPDGSFEANQLIEIEQTFNLACLLHDVGHSPFSHSGESFFLKVKGKDQPFIYEQLIEVVNNTEFTKDVQEYYHKGKEAAPHEIMSVIVAITNYNTHINSNFTRDFFARCVTGYSYRNKISKQKIILNSLIGMLNSSLIDVDKLDYIIRDSYTTGFDSVSIDFERLLSSFITVERAGTSCLAYHKKALSVIENVIYAHDAERKWIQNHPTILYEHFLVQHAIRNADRRFCKIGEGKKLFSLESISLEGNIFDDNTKVSLLSDDDIICDLKNNQTDNLQKEYFSRNKRRHPVWKSEAEYRALFDNEIAGTKLDELEDVFKTIEKYLIENLFTPIIDDSFIEHCKNELNRLNTTNGLREKDVINLSDGINKMLEWACYLKSFLEGTKIPFSFVVVSANKFTSGFLKKDLENVLVHFPGLERTPKKIKDVSSILSANQTREKFFYLYYYTDNGKINASDFANSLKRKLF